MVQKNQQIMTQKLVKWEKKLTDKYISTPEFNKLSPEIFAARLKQANLVTKTDFDNSNKTKLLLKMN